MKKIFFICIYIASSFYTQAQGSVHEDLKNHYRKTYQQGLQYNDVLVVINALQNIIAASEGNESHALKDTLAMFYFASKSYLPALLLSKEVYQADPSNILSLTRSAECYQQLGDLKTAVSEYEMVTTKIKNPYIYYQLAACQYSLKRYAECEENLKKLLTDSSSNSTTVHFVLPNGNEQEVPVSAAGMNMLAVIKMDNMAYTEAKKHLEKSLQIFPEFTGAKQNLIYCNDQLKAPGTVKPKQKN